MILTFDIGNTRINIGLFENGSLVKRLDLYERNSNGS